MAVRGTSRTGRSRLSWINRWTSQASRPRSPGQKLYCLRIITVFRRPSHNTGCAALSTVADRHFSYVRSPFPVSSGRLSLWSSRSDLPDSAGAKRHSMTVDELSSFLRPISRMSLGELLTALWSLLEDTPATRCSWELEPGEYRWVFTRHDDQAALSVLAFPDNSWENGPDEEGTTIFDISGPLDALATAFVDGFEAVLQEYGVDGFRERWNMHPFPSEFLSEVKALLHP